MRRRIFFVSWYLLYIILDCFHDSSRQLSLTKRACNLGSCRLVLDTVFVSTGNRCGFISSVSNHQLEYILLASPFYSKAVYLFIVVDIQIPSRSIQSEGNAASMKLATQIVGIAYKLTFHRATTSDWKDVQHNTCTRN